MTGSYTYNGYLLRDEASGNTATLIGGGQAGDINRLYVPPVKRAAEVPVLCDGATLGHSHFQTAQRAMQAFEVG